MAGSSRILAGFFLFLSIGILVLDSLSLGGLDRIQMAIPDFGVYYTASKVSYRGENPFDLEVLGAEQQKIQKDFPALQANSGPWALAAVRPWIFFRFHAARLSWLCFEIALIIFCSDVIWSLYKGSPDQLPLVWLIALGFYATLQSIWLGQLSVLILTAYTVFLLFEKRYPFFAGMALPLLIIKPQNHLPVMLIGILWILHRRQFKLLSGYVVGLILFTSLAVWGNPKIFEQYLEMLRTQPPSYAMTPVPAMAIRYLIGFEQFRLNFLLVPMGLLWGMVHYYRNRETWNWQEQLPLLTIVSYLISPYAWAYSQIVFLFALLQIVSAVVQKNRLWWIPTFLLIGSLIAYYLVMLKSSTEFHWIWLAPAMTVGYLGFRYQLGLSNRSSKLV